MMVVYEETTIKTTTKAEQRREKQESTLQSTELASIQPSISRPRQRDLLGKRGSAQEMGRTA